MLCNTADASAGQQTMSIHRAEQLVNHSQQHTHEQCTSISTCMSLRPCELRWSIASFAKASATPFAFLPPAGASAVLRSRLPFDVCCASQPEGMSCVTVHVVCSHWQV